MRIIRSALFLFRALIWISLAPSFGPGSVEPSQPQAPPRSLASRPLQSKAIARPLGFEPNQGQTAPQVRYLAHGHGYEFFVTDNEVIVSISEPETQKGAARSHTVVRAKSSSFKSEVVLKLIAASRATPTFETMQALPGRVNYFIGNDPKKWRSKIPTYGRIVEHNVWPAIDLAWYGDQSRLESDFIIGAGASPNSIRLAIEGTSKLAFDAAGDVTVGPLKLLKPVIYQTIGTTRRAISGGYVWIRGKRGGRYLGFQVASYDRARPLVIDPVVVPAYSTYLGGSGKVAAISGDAGNAIAVDAAGNAYVTGRTSSVDFPLAIPFQTSLASANGNAFVTKFSADGSSLIYSTYFGGSGATTVAELGDFGAAIAVDSSGCAYVTGQASSLDFPTLNPFQPQLAGKINAFVSKFSADGGSLIYSTYLGGSGLDIFGNGDLGTGIAVDSSGRAYVTGRTPSSDFPIFRPFQGRLKSNANAFVTKFTPNGTALVYSTYLGGSGGVLSSDAGSAIAVDGSGSAYVTGQTASSDFPTQNPYQASLKSVTNAFVTKFSADGTSLVYSTYLGGSGYGSGFNQSGDFGSGIAVDSSGSAYVTGQAYSPDFPLQNPFQSSNKGIANAFVTKFSADGGSLIYSTYLGGSGTPQPHSGGCDDFGACVYGVDYGTAIAVDGNGSAYVTGQTFSRDFPVRNPLQSSLKFNSPFGNAFVSKFSADGASLEYSTYLGGSGGDVGASIAVDASGGAYLTGTTHSGDFPLANALQNSLKSEAGNGFVTKLSVDGGSLAYSTYLGGSGTSSANLVADAAAAIAVDSSGSVYVTGSTNSSDFPVANALRATLGSTSGGNAFVSKFSADGGSLVYSTYLGGTGFGDAGYGIAIDANGDAYITGSTRSADFPTQNPSQGSLGTVNGNAFLTKLAADGGSLIYSTYLGGSGFSDRGDYGTAVALDSSGSAYVTGFAASRDFPLEVPFQATNNGLSSNAFVTKFTPNGTALVYSTYLGGSGLYNGGGDAGNAISVDASGSAYVTGRTVSLDFPTNLPFQGHLIGDSSAFVTKFSTDGRSLVYSTYLGGSSGGNFFTISGDAGNAIAVDLSSSAYVTGRTFSPSFPTKNAFQSSINIPCLTCPPVSKAFVTKFTPDGSSLIYSTYLGGSSQPSGGDFAKAIAVDSSGSAYVTGFTDSADFPLAIPFQTSLASANGNAFVTKFSADGLALEYSTYLGGSGTVSTGTGDFGVDIAVDSTAGAYVAGVTASADFPVANAFQPTLKGPTNAFVTKLIVTSSTPGPKLTISPHSLAFGNKVTVGTTSKPKTVRIKNAGSKKGAAVSIEMVSASPSVFAVTSKCEETLMPGKSCKASVTFKPVDTTPQSGSLMIFDNVTGAPQTVGLSGTGKAAKKK